MQALNHDIEVHFTHWREAVEGAGTLPDEKRWKQAEDCVRDIKYLIRIDANNIVSLINRAADLSRLFLTRGASGTDGNATKEDALEAIVSLKGSITTAHIDKEAAGVISPAQSKGPPLKPTP